jgi:hypothetical protein
MRVKGSRPLRTSNSISVEKLLFFAVVLLAIFLALKSFKQFVYLSFTLLSLKIVWILLLVLGFLTFVKKRT